MTQRRRRRQVCLFGTSADPPTGEGGHLGIVRALAATSSIDDDCSSSSIDEVRVLPVYQHQFQNKRNRLGPFEHRYNMCQLAFRAVPKVVVSDCEKRCFEQLLAKSQHNDGGEDLSSTLRVGTADLLDMLLQEEPDTDFYFAMGADTFMDLTDWKWKRSKDVFKLLEGRIVTFERPGLLLLLDDNNTTTALEERVEHINTTMGASVRLLKISSLEAVSSTLIRSMTSLQELQDNQQVTAPVKEYMVQHQLYGFAESDGGNV